MRFANQTVVGVDDGAKVINRYVLNQGAAGTTVIVAAVANKRHKIVGVVLTLSVAGTLKFTDSTPADLTGPFDIGATGGFVVPTNPSVPLVQTAVNKDLNIVTTGGAARGVILYITE